MFHFHSQPTPKHLSWGKPSRIPNTINHVLFYDYDAIDEATLFDEQKALIEEYHYGNIYVFKLDREEAFHCVCLDIYRLNEIKNIVMSSSCDLGFVLAPRYDKFRNWVLRDSPKGERNIPVYYKTIESQFEGERKQSSAHARFLNLYYNTNIVLKNPDNNPDDIDFECYLTASRTTKDKEVI